MNTVKYNSHLLLVALCFAVSISLTNCAANKQALSEDPYAEEKLTSDEYERLGTLYFSRGDVINAFVSYEKCLRLDPDNTRVHYMKGLLFTVEGQYPDAIASFQKVLDKEPGNALAHQGLGHVLLQDKQYGNARKHLEEAITRDATLWNSHNLLGVTYDYEKNHTMAIQEYEAALKLQPENGIILNNMGLSYSMAGEHEKAIATLTRALQTSYAKDKTYNNLGLAFFRAGRHQEAFEALQKGGDDAQALNNLGSMYLWRGNNEKARECFEKALTLRPTNYDTAQENLKKCSVTPFSEEFFASPGTGVTGGSAPAPAAQDQAYKLSGNLLPYRVKKGDTPFSIARSHNMEYGDFIRLNNLDEKSIIYPNQVLLVRPQ